MVGTNYRTWPTWLTQVAVVVGYIALFAVIRPFSDAHWSLTAGLRLSALLLFPSRYWLALALGDALYSSPQAISCEAQYGLPWAIAYTFPLTAVAMPAVWWCKEKLSLFPSKRLVNFNTFILCAIASSACWSLFDIADLWVIPHRGYEITPLLFGSMFVGSFVAVLTITPWAIMARLGHRTGTLKAGLRAFIRGSLFFDAALVVLPALLILSWLTYRASEANKPIWALFMFAPCVWLTVRHGWRATVIAGSMTVASICLLFTWDGNLPDTEVVQVQAIIAFAITCLIAMGARITAMHELDEIEKTNARQAMQLARQSMIISEMRLKQASETLEQVCGEMQLNQNRLLNRFRLMLPVNESLDFTRRASSTQEKVYQLADAMHPIAWRRRGLIAALRETIGRALDEVGVAYQCKVMGRGLSLAGKNLHTMIYRLACESVVYIGGSLHCTSMRLLIRGGYIDGQRVVILRVEGFVEEALQGAYPLDGQKSQLASKLGASKLTLHQLRDNARLFNGELHVRATAQKIRITALLIDTEQKERERHAPSPFSLWAG